MENSKVCENGVARTPDGIELYYSRYRPTGPKASILIIHGIGEHSGRYAHVAEFLCGSGYAVYTFDLRGHGRSKGQRGHILDFDDYSRDVEVIKKVIAQDDKVCLLGHSLGGLIAARHAIKYPSGITGIILSSPAIGLSMRIPFMIEALTAVFSAVCPALSLKDNAISSEYLTHDREIVKSYDSDPLVHRLRTVRFVSEFNRALKFVSDNSTSLKVPAFILQAGDDKIVSGKASRAFFERIGSKIKEYKSYPGYYHEILNETGRISVLEDIKDWLDTLV
jgi:alpha-beta hydrolase superfamily lysophospholipase